MRPSPLLSAAAAASLLAAVAGPAMAATDPLPAAGLASSTVTLLDVAAGGRTLSAGSVSLLSDALGADAVARILATPLTVDGTPYGQQTITPADGPTTLGTLDSGTVAPALTGLVKVTSPVLNATATDGADGPATRVGSSSLGAVSVLGLPLTLAGSLDAGSVVNRTTGATGNKTLEVTDLALPSIADLLAALGLDITKLPTDVLVELLGELDLLTPTVTAADKAVDDARAAIQAQIDAAQKTVDDATAQLKTATDAATAGAAQLDAAKADLATKVTALATAEQALATARQPLVDATAKANAATADLTAALAALSTPLTIAEFELLGSAAQALLPSSIGALYTAYTTALAELATTTANTQATIAAATTGVATATSARDVAASLVTTLTNALATLQAAVDSAQRILDAAIAVLQGVLKDVLPLVQQLLLAITTILDGTPLVSIDGLRVVTASKVTSATDGGQSAEVVGGEVEGLRVLGTDVLSDVLGTSSVDVLDLTGTTLASVNALVGELTGTLSEVLSTVPGFPALSIPAPRVELLTKQAGTGIAGGFGTATTSLRALAVTLPSITLPQALALPTALDLPVFDTVLPTGVSNLALLDAVGNLVSTPVTVAVGTLSEQARFRAAAPGSAAPVTGQPTTGTPTTGTPTTGTPTTGTPVAGTPTTLPRTGASAGLAGLAAVLLAGAFVARRRSEVLEEL